MPGIAGIIAIDSAEADAALANTMVGTMRHEPFYTGGMYANARLGLSCGWTAFAEGFDAGMPLWNEQRDVGLIFSGEVFGKGLDGAGALINLYEKLGLSFLERLNGWFSGLLLDLRQDRLVLFNDRYGVGRIYYHESDGRFYFASEAKALLRVVPTARQFDTASLGEFFSCGCVLQNRSLFEGVSLLPGGSMWIFSGGRPLKRAVYFESNTWENQPRLGFEEYYGRLKEIFPRVVSQQLGGGERIGVSLTGGVDSRMIMACVQRPRGSLPCYTFGGTYHESVDVKVARQVALICGQPHRVIEVGDSFIRQFPTLAEQTVYITDGIMDVTGAADLFVNRVAREISPFRLTGNYGGEILREIVAFKPVPLRRAVFTPNFASQIDAGRQTYAQELQERRLSFVAFKQVPWYHYSRLSLERSQITMRSPYLDNELVQLVYQAPAESFSSNEISLRMISEGNPELGRLSTDRGVLRASLPIITSLRHAYQEFTFKAEYAYDYGMPQWLARLDSWFKPLHLERLFLGRHKFHHFRVWYRDRLANYLKDVLLDARSLGRRYLNGPILEKMVHDHIAGRRNYTLEIHRILTTELTQRLLLERAC